MMQTSEQRQKVAFATVLDEAATAHLDEKAKVVQFPPGPRKSKVVSGAFFKIAAVVIVAAALIPFLWVLRARKTEVDRGMLALNEAYKKERLIESRISGFNYSPLTKQTRGGDAPNIDNLAQRQAELLLTEAVRTNHDATSHHALGRVYLAEKKFDQAIQQFQQALKLDPNNARLHSDLAACFLETGKAERGADDGKAAENFGKSLEHADRALQLDPSALEALFNRGLVLEQLKLLPQAEQAWHTYLQKDSSTQWAEEARRHLDSLQKQNRITQEQSTDRYNRFVSAYRNRDRQGVWRTLAQSRSRMGNQIVNALTDEYLTLHRQNRAADAEEQLAMLKFAGEVEAERVGDLYTLDLATFYSTTTPSQRERLAHARSVSAAGLKSYDQSEFDKAIDFYTEALRELTSIRMNPEALFTESWVGYSELRRDGIGALRRFERLAETYKAKSYKSLHAQAIHAQSDAWTDRNELSKVLALAGDALKISEAIEDDSTRLRCLQQFVSMNLKFGNYIDSLKFGVTAIDVSQRFLNEPKLIWTFYHELALDFLFLGMPAASMEFENRALELAKQSAWPMIIVRSYTQLGRIYEQQGDFTSAISKGLLAIDEGKKINDEKTRLTTVSHAVMRLGHIYRQAADFNESIDRYDDALRMFEQLDLGVFRYETHKGKFMAFLGAGKVAEADAELHKALALFEDYRPKIQEERNRDSFFDVGHDIYDLAIDFAYNKLSDRVKAFDYSEQSRSRSLLGYLNEAPRVIKDKQTPDLQHRSSTRALGFNQLRERLPEGVQIVEYAVGADRLFLWVVTRDKLESGVIQISGQQLEEKVSAFVRQIREPSVTHDTIETAQQLHSILIDPIQKFLDTSKDLYIVPDKALVKVPFNALKSASDGKSLLQKFTLAFTPSANILVACTDRARSKRKIVAERALVVGDPSFSSRKFPDLPKLPSAGREAQEVAAFYGSSPLLAADAQEARVKDQMKNVDVIHLASHFVVDPHSSMLSKLLLASENYDPTGRSDSDGVLQVSEIYELKLTRPRLVVLPACQTGIERSYQGEGAISVARSFISVGVPLVVATLWPVESEITSELMINFHRYRKVRGLPTVQALRQAQLDLMGSRSNPNALNEWAAFVAIGGHTDY